MRLTDARIRDLIQSLQELQMTRKTTTAKGRGKTTTTSTGGTTTPDPAPAPSPTPLPAPPPVPAATSIPDISAGAGYTGTEKSGGTPPAFIVRTGAMCAARWMQESELRFWQDTVIGVEAEALGGIAYVDFWFEGGTGRAYRTNRTVTNPRTGASMTVSGFFANLIHEDRYGAAGKVARVFATAHANDPTIQDRVIGWWSGFNGDGVGGDSGYSLPAEYLTITGNSGIVALVFDTPMRLHPRTTAAGAFDWYATVKPGQSVQTATHTLAAPANYQTLNAANEALASAINAGTAENGQITLGEAGSYDPGEPSTVVAGVMMSRTTASAAATIYRGASFDPLNTNNTAWRFAPAVSLMEFYGPNLTIDRKNWTQLQVPYNRGVAFRGCYITNSIGTNQTGYWMGRDAPQWKVVNWNSGFPLPTVYDCVDFTYAEPTPGLRAMLNCTLYKGTILALDAAPLIKDTYAHLSECSFYLPDRAMLRVRCSVSGTNTLSKANNKTFTLSDANGTATFDSPGADGNTPATSGNQSNSTMATLVAWIGARSGWTASVLDTSGVGAWALFGTESGSGSQVVPSTDVDIHGQVNNHSELLHWHWGENGIVAESYLRDCSWTTNIINIEQNNGPVRDVIVRNSIFTLYRGVAGLMSTTGSAMNGSHTCLINCVLDDSVLIGKDTDAHPSDNYSGVFNSVLSSTVEGFTSGSWPTLGHGGQVVNVIAKARTNQHPNVLVSLPDLATFTALFRDLPNGDARAALAGTLAANLVATSTFKIDNDFAHGARATTDAVGTYALTASAPVWAH